MSKCRGSMAMEAAVAPDNDDAAAARAKAISARKDADQPGLPPSAARGALHGGIA